MVRANLGLGPWNIFHQGLHLVFGISIGTATILAGLSVLLTWIPFRQKPGIGTLLNVLFIGPCADLALYLLPEPSPLALRIIFLIGGQQLLALGIALYLGTKLGPGPRDGLMLSLSKHFGLSIRLARTLIECFAFLGGWMMGGTIGWGSIYSTFMVGPSVQFSMRLLDAFNSKIAPEANSP